MSILNSREHSCIRPLDYPFTSKTEMCKALLDKKNTLDENYEGKVFFDHIMIADVNLKI
jgi:hypothetical protein